VVASSEQKLTSPVRLKLALRPPGPDGKLSVLTAGSMDFSSSNEGQATTTSGSSVNASHHRWSSLHSYSEEDMGIIPRMCEQLFALLAFESAVTDFKVAVTYVEIYQGSISDLLSQGNPLSLKLETDVVDAGIFKLSGAKKVEIHNMDNVFELLTTADAQKKVFATAMNDRSSRSHCIFSLELTQTEKKKRQRGGGREPITITSTLSLADLAGSERVKSTNVTGQRLSEARAINKSLTALQRCIQCLREGNQYVPYRDSTITRFLQNALGGNSRTVLVTCCALEQQHLLETGAALRFAERVMSIRGDHTALKSSSAQQSTTAAKAQRRSLKTLSVLLKSQDGKLSQGPALSPSSSLQQRLDASPYQLFSSFHEQVVAQRKKLEEMSKRHQSYARTLITFQGLLQSRDSIGASLYGAFAIFAKHANACKEQERRFGEPTEPKWMSVDARLAIALGVCRHALAMHARDPARAHGSIVPSNVCILPQPPTARLFPAAEIENGKQADTHEMKEDNAFRLYASNLAVHLVRDSELAGRVPDPMHLAPEVLKTRQATPQSDVFSFGILLLLLWQRGRGKKLKLKEKELQKVYSNYLGNTQKYGTRVNVLDLKHLTSRASNKREYVFHLSSSVPEPIAALVEKCTSLHAHKRPSMKDVSGNLEDIRRRYHEHHAR
jgi:serine/threonine protein kinase